ncbi:myophilin-like [Rhopilema esculentum]|uniref:myophilin-like n=1 Tax=Rhopilema esculentum TaxID=499914 RepID=UPI0031DFFB9F|eukprot:gene17517-9140_t
MAEPLRPKGYGMTAAIKNKIAGKYDPKLEEDSIQWIEAILGEGTMQGAKGADAVQKVLKDGSILCKLINVLQPGSVKKINTGTQPMILMENTGKFLQGCEKYGVKKADLFQSVDLFENQNMDAVIKGIVALGRMAQIKGFDGPTLGPKQAEGEKREWSEEQLKAGQGIIGLQMGTNKGASQAGMTMGKSRAIID